MAATRIVLFKAESGTRYHSVLHRLDGVQVRLEGGSWNKVGGPARRVPHDLAHLIVEREFGLNRGLWGVLAAGGTVQNASVIAGRQPPRAAARAEAIVAPARPMLQQAEVLVRATADLALAGRPNDLAHWREAVGERWRMDSVTPDDLARTCGLLQAMGVTYNALPPGGSLRVEWTGG